VAIGLGVGCLAERPLSFQGFLLRFSARLTHQITPDTGSWWDQRYREGSDRWELGAPAPPLQLFFSEHAQAPKPPAQVLVPGCGRGHEAAFLAARGFAVVGLDFSAEAIAEARRLHGEQPARLRWLQADLLDGDALAAAGLGPASCDGVLEHTCYCAIDPHLRPAYRQSVARLIKPQGWLLGLFWCHGRPGGPPYGSDADQLVADFTAAGFSQELWFPATNSAPGPDNQSRDHEWVGLWRRVAH
jgi:SAM-dependent methyltransferase